MSDTGGASAKIVTALRKRRRKKHRPARAPWDRAPKDTPRDDTPVYKPGDKKPGVPY